MGCTIIINEIRDTNPEQCAVEARIQACDPFALNDAPDGVVGCGLGAFGFDLSAGGEGDERVAVGLSVSVLGLCGRRWRG